MNDPATKAPMSAPAGEGRSLQSGFTLIEIMIAMFILAGLSVLTAQAIRSSTLNRDKISREIAADSAVRDVLKVMERDVSVAFHHRDIFTAMLNQIEKDRRDPVRNRPDASATPGDQPADRSQGERQGLNPPGAQPAAEAFEEKQPPKQLTAFFGEPEQVHFTALANVRTQLDVQESDQAEVGYFIRDCKTLEPKPGGKKRSSRCLVRRISPVIDEDVTKGGDETVLLEHITIFKLRYFGPEREDWVEQWKTGENGDRISKENFPYAVEVTLAMHDQEDPKAKKVEMVMVAPLRFPNNPPKKQNNAGDANAPN